MIPFVSAMGRGATRAALKANGWGLILNPRDDRDPEDFVYGLDNDAFPTYQAFLRGERETPLLDLDLFERLVDRRGSGALFVVAPDIVAGGLASLELSREWFYRLSARPDLAGVKILIAVQDGMESGAGLDGVRDLLSRGAGLFVGGETKFKEQTLALWGEHRREFKCWLHVGRVNTTRRVYLCQAATASSFDGSSAAKWSRNIAKLTGAARSPSLFVSEARNYVAA